MTTDIIDDIIVPAASILDDIVLETVASHMIGAADNITWDGGRDAVTTGLLPSTINECSLVADSSRGVCMDEDGLSVAALLTNTVESEPIKIVEEAKQALGCQTERCVVESDAFIEAAGKSSASKQLAVNFKVIGPTDTSLLNNVNIDTTLKQWAAKFIDFYAFDFNMRDFKKARASLATTKASDLYKKGFRTFGCVINSDVYSGRGIHWMAIFGDMRGDEWTVEFFNSSGNEPAAEFADYLVSAAADLTAAFPTHKTKIFKATGVEHQKTITECGVYALYYIWARLNNTPPDYFTHNVVTDVLCFELRQHLFYDKTREQMNAFDYDKYAQTTKIKWEPGVDPATVTGGNDARTQDYSEFMIAGDPLPNYINNQLSILLMAVAAIPNDATDVVLLDELATVETDLALIFPKVTFHTKPPNAPHVIVGIDPVEPTTKTTRLSYLIDATKTTTAPSGFKVPLCYSGSTNVQIVCDAPFKPITHHPIPDYKNVVLSNSFHATPCNLPVGIDSCRSCAVACRIVGEIDVSGSPVLSASRVAPPHGVFAAATPKAVSQMIEFMQMYKK